MKRRVATGFAAAVAHLKERLGIERVAAIVNRGQALVYKWADPDLALSPNIRQALDLDVAFVNDGHGPPPFLTAYTALLRRQTSHAIVSHDDLLKEAQELVATACKVLTDLAPHKPAADGNMNGSALDSLRNLGELQAALAWKIEQHGLEGQRDAPRRGFSSPSMAAE